MLLHLTRTMYCIDGAELNESRHFETWTYQALWTGYSGTGIIGTFSPAGYFWFHSLLFPVRILDGVTHLRGPLWLAPVLSAVALFDYWVGLDPMRYAYAPPAHRSTPDHTTIQINFRNHLLWSKGIHSASVFAARGSSLSAIGSQRNCC